MNAVVKQSEKSAYERLKRRHQKFVDQIVDGKTVGDAALAVGSRCRSPKHVGHRWLQRQEIKDAVAERTAIAIHDAGVHSLEVMRQSLAIATSDVRRLFDAEGALRHPKDLDDATAAAIASIEVEEVSTGGREGTRFKYKFWDKGKANDRLGQYCKLWDAAKSTVNVDARSVHLHGGESGALRAVAELGRSIAAIGAGLSVQAADPNGPVLPVALRDEPKGRGASVDAGADSRSAGAT